MTAKAGLNAQILITGVGVTISTGSPAAYTDSGDHINYTPTSTKRYLDDSVATTVQTSPDGTTWTTISPTLYSIQYVGAKIKFTPALASGTQVRINAGSYLPYSAMADATKAEPSAAAKMVDTTSFTTSGTAVKWSTFLPTTNMTTLKITKWNTDNTFLAAITAATRYVLSLLPDVAGSNRMEAYATTKVDGIKAAMDGLVEEDLEFQVSGSFYLV